MRPCDQLEGMTVDNGWSVVKRIDKTLTATGGRFSTGYVVRHPDGREGFLKAIDYSEALKAPDTALALHALTTAYLFEKEICAKCCDHHLSRVARAIDSGAVFAGGKDPINKVEYLIFELADGDVRKVMDLKSKLDTVFVLRTLHHVATALKQLHTAQIAHQDLKPSNVLVFKGNGGSKVGDLGRAWSKDLAAPHDTFRIAGDQGYAPPEFLYGEIPIDAETRRFGCDAYHLGNLATFLFTRADMNTLVIGRLHPDHRPAAWAGPYTDVLPYLYAAYATVLDEVANQIPVVVRGELREIISQLCEPNPKLRGHPMNRSNGASQFSLERFVTRFDLLAHKMQFELTHRFN